MSVTPENPQPPPEVLAVAPQTQKTPPVGAFDVDVALKELAKKQSAPMVDARTAHNALATDLFGTGDRSFRLPCGAIVNGVLYDMVFIREMTGVEEAILSNENMDATERYEQCMIGCITKLESSANPSLAITDRHVIAAVVSGSVAIASNNHGLTVADRVAVMVFVRRASIGDLYKFSSYCPHCNHKNTKKELDLSRIKMDMSPSPMNRRVRFTLPKSKIPVVLKVLDGRGEKKASLILKELKSSEDNKDNGVSAGFDQLTLVVLARLDSVGDVQLSSLPLEKQVEVCQRMGRQDRIYIRDVINRIEGAIDTDVEVTCVKCNRDHVFPLDLGHVFTSTYTEVSSDELEWI